MATYRIQGVREGVCKPVCEGVCEGVCKEVYEGVCEAMTNYRIQIV